MSQGGGEEPGWILGVWNPASRRHAVFCDEGDSTWFYLTEPGPNGPSCPPFVASAFVCNRLSSPPPVSEVRSWAPAPPPAAEGYAGPAAYYPTLAGLDWEILWSSDGHSAALLESGAPTAMIVAPKFDEYSRHLLKEGSWGKPWSEATYHQTFHGGDGP